MIKRMFLLSAALMVSLAFAAPTQAGFDYTASGSFTVSSGTASDVEILMAPGSGPLSITSLTGSLPAGATAMVTTTTLGGTTYPTIEIDFSPTSSGNFAVTFSGSATASIYTYFLTGLTSNTSQVGVTLAAVPEPSSIALLGIGISGFIAFRRRFAKPKKHPVV